MSDLTLIVAPAGYGKTTFCQQLYAGLEHDGQTLCWVSLEESDLDSVSFLARIASGLKAVTPQPSSYILKVMETNPEPDFNRLTVALLHELNSQKTPFVLFLDDYHLAETTEHNQFLNKLANCPNLSLVISCHTKPALPYSKLRLKNQLKEIGPAELCFNQQEIGIFLSEIHHLDLDEDVTGKIWSNTGGWPAVLQLAALCLKRQIKDMGTENIARLDIFSVPQDDIMDYLAQDVFDKLPAEIRSFLLITSAVDQFSNSLAHYLTDRANSDEIISRLKKMNMVQTRETLQGFQYHYPPLFRKFLMQTMNRLTPKQLRDIYIKAGHWYLEHDDPRSSTQFFLLAHDYATAAVVIVRCAMQMVYSGHILQLNNWMQNLPDDLVDQKIQLLLIKCWVLFHIGRWREGEKLLDKIKLLKDSNTPLHISEKQLEAELIVLHSGMLMAKGHPRELISYATEYLPVVEKQDAFLAGTMANILGSILLSTGNFVETRKVAKRAFQWHVECNCPYGLLFARLLKVLCDSEEGRFSEAEAEIHHARQCALDHTGSFCNALTRVVDGIRLYMAGKPEQARMLINDNLPLIKDCGNYGLQFRAAIIIASLAAIGGNRKEALVLLSEYTDSRSALAGDELTITHEVEKIRILLMANDPVGAGALFTSIDKASCLASLRGRLTAARLCLAEGSPENALELLAGLPATPASLWEKAELRLLRTLAFADLAQDEEALDGLVDIVKFLPDEFAMLFVEGGQPVKKLIRRFGGAVSGRLPPGQAARAQRLFQAVQELSEKSAEPTDTPAQHLSSPYLLEPLSRKEKDVLALLIKGDTNKTIARTLNVSIHTVKWHVRHILEKFAVDNRSQVMAKVRDLDIPF